MEKYANQRGIRAIRAAATHDIVRYLDHAIVEFFYADEADPDGICPEPSSEFYELVQGKVWFARSWGSDTWVSFKDLSKDIRYALWKKFALEMEKKSFIDGIPVEEWIAIRQEEALKIDPETAEKRVAFVDVSDPYGLKRDSHYRHEAALYDYEWFVRRPGGEIWVYFGDLPKPVRDRLWERDKESASISGHG